jgi:hypothetical protein
MVEVGEIEGGNIVEITVTDTRLCAKFVSYRSLSVAPLKRDDPGNKSPGPPSKPKTVVEALEVA